MANPEESSSPAVPSAPPVGPPPTLAESAAAAGLATLSLIFFMFAFSIGVDAVRLRCFYPLSWSFLGALKVAL